MKFQSIIFNKIFYVCLYNVITISIYAQSPTFVSINTTDTECGTSTGSITLTPILTGTYSYLWNNGNTTNALSNLAMGDYVCTVTKDGSTEIIDVSIYRKWDLAKLIPGDPTLSIVGNSVTVNPNLPYGDTIANQQTHCYDKTPIDIQNQTGSIFAKFAKTHPNFPNQIANSSSTAPPVFYIALFETKELSNPVLNPLFIYDANLRVVTGGRLPEKIFTDKGVNDIGVSTYSGFEYTEGSEFEVRFLGNRQIEVYLESSLIYSTTLPQKTTNEYVVAVGFNERPNLDRRIAYDLKSSFCSTMPVVKTVINHNNKYGATGNITLSPLDLSYVNNSYTYQWSTGATSNNISNLSKGDYMVTITNGSGASKVETYEILDKLTLEKADPVNSILKIVDNHVTCTPDTPMQSISDYRTHSYDPTVIIDVVQGGGSVKLRVAAEHPAFPNQHSNTDNYNAGFAIRLQAATNPLPVPSFFLDYPFQIVFGPDGRVHTVGRESTWNWQNYRYIPNFHYPKGGFDIELRFTGNKVVEIYMNDIWVATRTLAEPIDKYNLMVGFSDDATRQRRIAYNMRTNINSKTPVVYAELKDILNSSYYPITDVENVVYFNYKEEYRAGTLNFVVYDDKRDPVSGVSLENVDLPSLAEKRIGTNRYKLTLPNNLDLTKFYLLEIANDKGEKQFLRFKRI